MFRSRGIFFGGLAALLFSSAAFAQSVPAYSWAGQYIGVHGGYAWAQNDFRLGGGSSGQFEPAGALFGLQFGHNHHLSRNWVLGYEVDVSSTDLDDRVGFANMNLRSFGTARTRLGYAQGPWLLYATGGLAWAYTKLGFNNPFDRPHVGYAIGAGVEYAFARNWSAKLEYIFADLGETNTSLSGGLINTDLSLGTVRAGLNYRFANWNALAAYNIPTNAPVHVAGWTGPYIGVHAGYGWGSFDTVFTLALVRTLLEPSGGIFGIQSGYNWQFARNWLVGVEGDSSWGRLRDSAGGFNIDVDAMGTVRARLGYTMNNVLLYGTGGFAWAHADSTTFGLTVRDQFYTGWAAGAGVEYAFAPRWSAKLEYLYSDFGTIRDLGVGPAATKFDVSTIKLGVNYRAGILELLGMRW